MYNIYITEEERVNKEENDELYVYEYINGGESNGNKQNESNSNYQPCSALAVLVYSSILSQLNSSRTRTM